MLAKVRGRPGVVAAAPFVHTQALVLAGHHKYMDGVFVEGLPPDGPGVPQVTTIRQRATAGDFTFETLDGQQRAPCSGQSWRSKLNVTPGIDSITLLSIDQNKIDPVTGYPAGEVDTARGDGHLRHGDVRVRQFVCLRVARDGAAAGAARDRGDRHRGQDADAMGAPEIGQQLADSLGSVSRGRLAAAEQSLFQALKLEKLGMTVILLLIVLVAAFNIVSTLDDGRRRQDAGDRHPARDGDAGAVDPPDLLRAGPRDRRGRDRRGARARVGRGDRSRHATSSSLSTRPVYFIDHLPVATQPLDVTLIVVASLAIAALATVYPALQAARLYPVEAIRHE